MQDNVYLIDASIFIYKNYHATSNDYRAKNGESINAVYGFIRFLANFIKQTKTRNIACAFDDSFSKSFRHEIYPEYKGNRDETPNELKKQFIICQKVAKAMGVACFKDSNFEADDLIGTLAHYHRNQGKTIYVVSADKDLAQLITNNDRWWSYGKTEPYDSGKIFEKFGVYPNQIADYLALTGDSVDNITGVAGVGDKTAAILLNHFGDLDSILKRHQEIAYLSFRGAKTCQKNINNHSDDAILARKLTGIVTDIPLEDPCIKRKGLDIDKLNIIFNYLNFGPILRKQILNLENI